jgi:hypothetical protein
MIIKFFFRPISNISSSSTEVASVHYVWTNNRIYIVFVHENIKLTVFVSLVYGWQLVSSWWMISMSLYDPGTLCHVVVRVVMSVSVSVRATLLWLSCCRRTALSTAASSRGGGLG